MSYETIQENKYQAVLAQGEYMDDRISELSTRHFEQLTSNPSWEDVGEIMDTMNFGAIQTGMIAMAKVAWSARNEYFTHEYIGKKFIEYMREAMEKIALERAEAQFNEEEK